MDHILPSKLVNSFLGLLAQPAFCAFSLHPLAYQIFGWGDG